MRWLIIICFLFQLSYAQTIPQHLKNPIGPAQARLILDQVREADLLSLLIDFTGCCSPSRMVGTPSHLKAHHWLESFFKPYQAEHFQFQIMPFDLDIPFAASYFETQSSKILKHLTQEEAKLREDILSLTQSRSTYLNNLKKGSTQGKNFFFEILGNKQPEEKLLIVTHFDTVTINKETWKLDLESPNQGADANGSGVAAVLMLSRILTQLNLPRTVQFLFLDAQSLGSLGARAYLKDHHKTLQAQNPKIIHIMTIGQKPPRHLHTRLDADGSFQAEDLLLAQEISHRARRLSPGIVFEMNAHSAANGDHNVFWQAGLSGVLLTQNWDNPEITERHHTSQDFVESLDRRAYYRSFRYLSSAVLSWAYQYSL